MTSPINAAAIDASAEGSKEPVGLIRAALLPLVGSRFQGAQLRQLIDATCPGFDLRAAAGVPAGPGALSKFLKTQFPDIVHLVGKHGGDNLYLIGPEQGTPITTNIDTNASPSLWAAFASPGLNQEIVYDLLEKRLLVRLRGSELSTNQSRLAPISAQEFREIASRFIDSAPLELQIELRNTLEEGEVFYHRWISILKARDAAVYHRWGLFRVQCIIDVFRRRLVTAGVPSEEIDQAVEALAADQAAVFKQRTQAIRGATTLSERPASPPPTQIVSSISSIADLNNFRSMAISAINNMSITEIRQLSVPLGAIFDAGFLAKK